MYVRFRSDSSMVVHRFIMIFSCQYTKLFGILTASYLHLDKKLPPSSVFKIYVKRRFKTVFWKFKRWINPYSPSLQHVAHHKCKHVDDVWTQKWLTTLFKKTLLYKDENIQRNALWKCSQHNSAPWYPIGQELFPWINYSTWAND